MRNMKLLEACFLLALFIGGATACCLPETFSVSFNAVIQDELVDVKTAKYNISGSFAADFPNQQFRFEYRTTKEPASYVWFFEFTSGEYVYMKLADDNSQPMGEIHPLFGAVKDDFRCVLGNKYFTEINHGIPVKSYKFRAALVLKMTGLLMEEKNGCLPFQHHTLSLVLGPGKYVHAEIDITRARIGKVVFPPSHLGRKTIEHPLTFPTLDEFATFRSENLSAMIDKLRTLDPMATTEDSANEYSGDWPEDSDDEDYIESLYSDASADGEPGPYRWN